MVYFACLIPFVELFPSLTGPVLVRHNYPRCKDVNLHTQRLVCEIHSQEDEMKIERFGLSGCYGSTVSCPEGDIKTCMPLVTLNTLHFQCFCHIDEKVTTIVSDYYWSVWKRLSGHFREFLYRRELVIDDSADFAAEEYSVHPPTFQYAVSDNSLPDNVYSASSFHNNHESFAARRARLDNYMDYGCCWAAGSNADIRPWLKISLPGDYEVVGIYIRQRCDYLQYPTIVDVTTSVDDVSWQDVVVGEDIAARYSSYDTQGFVTVWFSRSYTTRYWKIYIVQFIDYPAMKSDLIGYKNWY